ncbi:hypothetical protein [Flavobacterium sp. FlaQc-50]|uniref:hypothetical protein n=1 Tax=unclassified Flavobacterium TaxID=196869 RepID=UPI003757B7AB
MRLSNKLNNLQETTNFLSWQDLSADLVLCLCGERLGEGASRTTFVYNLDPKYVIKVEPGNDGHNMVEYLLWDEVKGLTGPLAWVKDWFAPVKWISPNGRLLVMERTYDKPEKVRPRYVPDFFTDLKRDNFGWIGNKFVCHDYAFIYRFIKYGKKMRKISKDKWW